ncbi:50S ribosomal protein L6 [Myxococcota bacterium]|nr:50S ribosomal protein L6 [Myxococcota bacterium]
MSRIGKMHIPLPKGVTIKNNNGTIHAKGPKGELSTALPKGISMVEEENELSFLRENDTKQVRMNHGLARANVANLVHGVSEGFTKTLNIIGVGYRCEMKGNMLVLSLGYSHPIYYEVPKLVECTLEERGLTIILKSIDKILLGKVASDIREFRSPEPYKGKGIRYAGEVVRHKEGKAKG